MRNKAERIRRSRLGPFGFGPHYLAREAKLKMDRNAAGSSGVTLVAVKGEVYAPLNESEIAQVAIRHWPKCLIGTYRRGARIPDIAEDIASIMDDCDIAKGERAAADDGNASGCCPTSESDAEHKDSASTFSRR